MRRLKVIFAGTPEFAAQHLRTLLSWKQHDVVAVYTQPDRPSGRGKKMTASAVKELAVSKGIPVFQPGSLKSDETQRQIVELKANLMVVVAYGLLLPKAVLNIHDLGCINVHASLLPRWRGAAPIQRAIEAGDAETGVTLMQMEEGLDTGPMLSRAVCAISDTDTAGTLQDKLAVLGAEALLKTLDLISEFKGEPGTEEQNDSLATYAHKITKMEAQIDWAQSAASLDCKIRAFNPMPVAFTRLGADTIRIWQARPTQQAHSVAPGTILSSDRNGIMVACGTNTLLLTEIQLAGKRRMAVKEVLQGRADLFVPGTQLGI
jgi:methionyl-tRNA formyltransferase